MSGGGWRQRCCANPALTGCSPGTEPGPLNVFPPAPQHSPSEAMAFSAYWEANQGFKNCQIFQLIAEKLISFSLIAYNVFYLIIIQSFLVVVVFFFLTPVFFLLQNCTKGSFYYHNNWVVVFELELKFSLNLPLVFRKTAKIATLVVNEILGVS